MAAKSRSKYTINVSGQGSGNVIAGDNNVITVNNKRTGGMLAIFHTSPILRCIRE